MRAPRAESHPRGEFFAPQEDAGERQIRDVHGPDQQHDHSTAPQKIESAPDAFDQQVEKRLDGGVKSGVDQQFPKLREPLQILFVKRVHLKLRLAQS